MKFTRFSTIVAAVTMTAIPQAAYATDVFRIEGFGPVSRAMGGTAVAYDIGGAGMMTNPATLSLMAPGSEFQLWLDVVTSDIAVENLSTKENVSSDDHSNNRGPYLAPQMAYTYQSGSLVFGAGIFAPSGLGTEYGNSSFLSRATGGIDTGLENSSRLFVLNIPFTLSYKVNNRLTVGLGIEAVWQGMNMEMLLGADQVGSLIGAGRVEGSLVPVLGGFPDLRGTHFGLSKNEPLPSGIEAWGFGGRVGLTYSVFNDTVLGAAYTMESIMEDMKGRASLTVVDGVLGNVGLRGNIKLRDFRMPAHAELGLSHRFNDHWMISIDVSQVFWKHAIKDLDVGFKSDGGDNIDILLPQNYRNQTIGSVGVAYRTGSWTLRAGGRIATQALRSDRLFGIIPAIPKKHLSMGLSYDFSKKNSFHFAYSHAFKESMDNSSLPNTSGPIRVSHSQNNFIIAYSRKFR